NATEVHDPRESRRIIDYDFFGLAPRREEERNGSQPLGTIGWRPFLVKRLAFRSVYETLEDDWTVLNSRERAWRDRKVVAYEVKFGELGLFGEIRLVGVGHSDLAAVDR